MKKIYRIYNVKYDNKFKNFFKFLDSLSEDYDEVEILPDYLQEEFLNHKEELLNHINSLDKENYLDKLNLYFDLFDKIQKPKVNLIAYKAINSVETNQTISSVLKQFKPQNGFSRKANYDNSKNISGRLTVNNSPNILVLPKRCRNIFESRFNNGKLLSIDFQNLEPRFCLKIVGKNIDGDIYETINNMLDFDIDRSIIKRAIISVLYGASHENLRNISANKAVKIFEIIKDHFELDYLYEISSKIDKQNVRRNFYGRPIWNLNEKRNNVVINNYVQSSAVDIALLYFSEITNILDLNKAVPIFIIHDAIVFDIEKDYVNEFKSIIMKGYNDKDLGNFPVSISQFNTECD